MHLSLFGASPCKQLEEEEEEEEVARWREI
jgi:hypothetical protein